MVFDGGEVRFSATTVERVGVATVRVLQREAETRNRMLFVQSLCVTQNQVLKSLERMMPRADAAAAAGGTGGEWTVEHVSSDRYIKDLQAKLEVHPDDAEEWENMVAVVGIVDANWEGKGEDFVNGLLGLENEDLDDVVRRSISGHV